VTTRTVSGSPTRSAPAAPRRRTAGPTQPRSTGHLHPVKRTRAPAGPRPRAGARPPARRLVALLVALVLGLVAILARLVQLQVRDASEYRELATSQRVRQIPLPPTRGSIFDRDGREMALSMPAKAVFADPELVTDPQRAATVVAKALDVKAVTVRRLIRGPGRFVYLARGVDLDSAATLKAALEKEQISGIGFLDESVRRYPAGNLAPHVVGFVGIDGQGLAGLERQHDEVLAGRSGHATVEANPQGILIPQGRNVDVPPIPGQDLVLTIDSEIQYRAQRALVDAVKENDAKGGTVIVLEPHTGEILAMATYPWFDPNRFGEADQEDVRNRAVTDVYEPGSVNKVVTAAAALEEGLLHQRDRVVVPSYVRLYSKVFRDVHDYPGDEMTLGDILAYSSNVGAITVARRLGEERLAEYLHRFGLGEETGLGFPGESAGILPPLDRWSGVHIGTVPIGQGVAVTPLQMAAVYATVANGGVWVQPKLVRATVGRDGGRTPTPPSPTRRVVSPETASWLTRMLGLAVEAGTGSLAEIPNFWVAGKTGTARKPKEDGTGYHSDRFVASFIGFVPASNPAVVVAAVIDEPKFVYGGIVSAPLFREVARFALAKLRVAPAPKVPLPPHAVPIPRG
jgi:cell division protein FtsI (penicillin-binding protein 3)